MSFKAKLKVDGKEFNILSCDYSLYQEVDQTGRASSITRGGIVKMTIESSENTGFFEMAVNNFERKDGSIVFYKRDTDATLKELTFEEAYLVKFKETFEASGTKPLTTSFTLSCRTISMGSAKHENEWV